MTYIALGWVAGLVAAAGLSAPIDVEAIAERNMGAVLLVTGTRVDDGTPVQGSGCCIHPDGYILTTAHQADGVSNFVGRLSDGTETPLRLVESRPGVEYALFKAAAPLPAHVPLGDAGSVKSGAPLVSIASPINLAFTTVTGAVSNPDKSYGGYPVMLVTLTATHGSSGGPVFDRNGKLIGLISGELTDIEFTIVNKINNAYPLLRAAGITVPAVTGLGGESYELVPVEGITESERRAIEAYNRGVAAETPEAKIAAYGLAVKLLPRFYEALFNLAVAEAAAGNLPEAAAHYIEAAKIRPQAVEVRRNLGRLYLRAEQYGDAVAVFKEALHLAPKDAQSHNDLGEAYRRSERPKDAIAHFQESLRLDNDAPGVHFNLALAYARAGQPRDAIRHFEAYLALDPGADDAAEVEGWIQELKASE